MQKTDAQLAREAAGGSTPSFGVLVERHRAPLVAVAAGVLRCRDEAEEVAQEALLRAWQKLRSLNDPARFGPWLRTIARNLALDRSRSPRPVPLPDDPPERSSSGDSDERIAELLAAVETLDEEFREVIYRKHFSQQSGRQIAEQLGIAEGTVRSRLSRAYARLRETIQRD